MTYPITMLFDLSEQCSGRSHIQRNIEKSLIVLDATIFITGLVVGLLGVFSVLHLPPAANYTMLGISGGIGVLWGAFLYLIKSKGFSTPFPCFKKDSIL